MFAVGVYSKAPFLDSREKPMNSKAKFLLTSSPIALIAALFAVNAAQAQGALEEIVVTAQKRDQSLQDVSVAVTAVSGDELKALGITDAFRLEILAPGLQLGMSGADPRPALRAAPAPSK